LDVKGVLEEHEMKVAVFTGSDLRNYGGGEKDVINWVTRLNKELDITFTHQRIRIHLIIV
jgi:hypothetical protein